MARSDFQHGRVLERYFGLRRCRSRLLGSLEEDEYGMSELSLMRVLPYGMLGALLGIVYFSALGKVRCQGDSTFE